jgi:hypothetical protein
VKHWHVSARRHRCLAAVCIVAGLTAGACSDDDGGDLSPPEPEAGEEDTEVVPGEGGPVE